jgi:hypothetical protein
VLSFKQVFDAYKRQRAWESRLAQASEVTQEEIYYNSEQHFHEMPYRIGDPLPYNFCLRTSRDGPYFGRREWPSWGRDAQVRGEAACQACSGRGAVLFTRSVTPPNYGTDPSAQIYGVLAEKECEQCDGTGHRLAKRLRIARENGFSTIEDHDRARAEQAAARAREERRAWEEAQRQGRREICPKCGGTGSIEIGWYGRTMSCGRCGGTGKRSRYRYR